jgi:wyosine [tRNA(Phe)-imidazoG37] synthetase (radical SAM superfamily)
MADVRRMFEKEIFLEVMLVKGINDSPEELERIRQLTERIKPDRIQLNTVMRPPAESFVERLDDYEMQRAAAQLGEKCEIIVYIVSESGTFWVKI